MREISQARKLVSAFHDTPSRGTKGVRIKIPSAGMDMGQVDAIDYTTRQGGKSVQYRHAFHAGSRAQMIVFPRAGLIILKGRFRVTGRGIVDLDEKGREMD